MAVALEFLNLVIPIEKIKQHYPGGWGRYLDDHNNLIGRRIWFDDYLLRDGAMNPKDMSDFIDEWVGFGLHHRGDEGKAMLGRLLRYLVSL